MRPFLHVQHTSLEHHFMIEFRCKFSLYGHFDLWFSNYWTIFYTECCSLIRKVRGPLSQVLLKSSLFQDLIPLWIMSAMNYIHDFVPIGQFSAGIMLSTDCSRLKMCNHCSMYFLKYDYFMIVIRCEFGPHGHLHSIFSNYCLLKRFLFTYYALSKVKDSLS